MNKLMGIATLVVSLCLLAVASLVSVRQTNSSSSSSGLTPQVDQNIGDEISHHHQHHTTSISTNIDINGETTTATKTSTTSTASLASTKKVLNLHIVPHTHDDVGWLKTVEQYYHGTNSSIQDACVSCILNTLIEALQSNPKRKFTYVEMAFFTMWYKDQSSTTQQIVKELVSNHQLSFANGGWCMHDEATTHYVGMIDQTTLGHEFLKNEFDYVPSIAWQLDPFGHSSTQASLLGSESGFNAIYFGRIDYQDLNKRHEEQNCEGIWDASSMNLNDTSIFWGLTGSYGGNYGAPEGFCFDVLCHDDHPIFGLDDDALYKRVYDFMTDVKLQVDRTRGDNVMLTMGSDFQFSVSSVNYENLDLLIDTINGMQTNFSTVLFSEYGYDEINAFYSTPEMYTDYKYQEFLKNNIDNGEDGGEEDSSSMDFEVKTDDFFPYSDCEHCFWTGYFTSRPALKKLERVGSSFLQTARQIQALFAKDTTLGSEEINELEKAMGIIQHHDGVSGTSKQHVAYDYAKKVQFGINEAESFVADVMKDIFVGVDGHGLENVSYCQLRNESICELSQDATVDDEFDTFYVVLYNALGHTTDEIMTLPVSAYTTYIVERGVQGLNEKNLEEESWESIDCELYPNLDHTPGSDVAPFNLIFDSGSIQPVSMTLFRIRNLASLPTNTDTIIKDSRTLKRQERCDVDSKPFTVENENIEIHFDEGGAMSRISTAEGLNISVSYKWGYYKSFSGNSNDTQASGAYIFRPEVPNEEFENISIDTSKTVVRKSPLLTEVHVWFEVPWIKEVVKVYKGKQFIDIEYTVGPIDISDGVGKEIVTRFNSELENDGVFFTDSNGREFLKRKRSERNTWTLQEFEPIAGNYYPVNTAIYIEDNNASIAVLTDRSQGGSSIVDGTVELMVHRRTTHDDGRGVDEPINETDSGISSYPPYGDASRKGRGILITGTHRLLLASGKTGAALARGEMDNMFSPLQLFAATAKSPSLLSSSSLNVKSKSALRDPLAQNLQLTTIKSISTKSNGINTFLVRLGHAYGYGESSSLSAPVAIDLSELLLDFEIVTISEKTLTGNRDKNDWIEKKMKWKSDGTSREILKDGEYIILIHPMEIRTFEVQAKPINCGEKCPSVK